MNKSLAQISSKKILIDSTSLNPSSLVTLFELDISDISFDKGIITSPDENNEDERLFRFHNNIPDINTNIFWQGKEYQAMPIKAEGFEIAGRGTLPTPRLSISVNEEGIPALSQLKVQLSKLGDLSGSKVTRIRTFYKYLDAFNFINGNPNADPNAEFPRDVYYIDRKSNENKNTIEFELASIFDVEGIQLPARRVLADRCPWQYRGEGCMYESGDNRVEYVHGAVGVSRLPSDAPPVATEQGDLISSLLPGVPLIKKGLWVRNTSYSSGDYVFIEKNGVKYYFIAKTAVSENIPPPNGVFWIADACSKLVHNGCKLRWGTNNLGVSAPGKANGNPHGGCLPFGGFPGVNKVR